MDLKTQAAGVIPALLEFSNNHQLPTLRTAIPDGDLLKNPGLHSAMNGVTLEEFLVFCRNISVSYFTCREFALTPSNLEAIREAAAKSEQEDVFHADRRLSAKTKTVILDSVKRKISQLEGKIGQVGCAVVLGHKDETIFKFILTDEWYESYLKLSKIFDHLRENGPFLLTGDEMLKFSGMETVEPPAAAVETGEPALGAEKTQSPAGPSADETVPPENLPPLVKNNKKYYWLVALIAVLIALMPFTCGSPNHFWSCVALTPVPLAITPAPPIPTPTVPPAVHRPVHHRKPAKRIRLAAEPSSPPSPIPHMSTDMFIKAMSGRGFVRAANIGTPADTAAPAPPPPVLPPVSGPMVATCAGSGSTGSNDGTGSAASFSAPAGIAVDGAGNLYVADSGDNLIRKITAAGMVTTLAGSAGVTGSTDGPGTAATFWHPWGIAVDGSGNLYVADQMNGVIRKISAAGVVATLAGTAGVYGSADGAGSAASFFEPAGVAVDAAGNVYVADSGNNLIRKIAPNGTVSTLAGSAKVTGSADGTGAAASFDTPEGVAVDARGNVYVTDSINDLIRKITPAGVVTTLAGSVGTAGFADGAGTAATFNTPFGITADASGDVYVADQVNNVIRKITPDGVVTTLAGTAGVAGAANGPGTSASFYTPFGIAADASGNLYISDTANNLIRKISQ